LVFIHNLAISSKIFFSLNFFLAISSKFIAIFFTIFSQILFSGAIWHQKAEKKKPGQFTPALLRQVRLYPSENETEKKLRVKSWSVG